MDNQLGLFDRIVSINAHGLTLEIPSRRPTGGDYEKLELSQFTGWPAAQRKICGVQAPS